MNALFNASPALRDIALGITAYCAASLAFGAAMVLLVAVAGRACRHLNAATRYVLWTIALVTIAFGPLVMTIVAQMPGDRVSEAQIASALSAAERSHKTIKLILPVQHPRIAISLWAAYGVAIVWGLVALGGAVRFAFGIAEVNRLKRDALPLAAERRAALRLWDARGRGVRARLCTSERSAVPIAVGLFDAMIVLPRSLLDDYDARDVDRFIAHELAHLERYDDWTSLFAKLAQLLLFFNPAVALIVHNLDLLREIACDDRVIAASCDARSYAAGLVRMAESTACPQRPIAAPAIFVTRRQLSLRVEHLIAGRRGEAPRAAVAAIGAALLASTAAVAAATVHAPAFTAAIDRARVGIETGGVRLIVIDRTHVNNRSHAQESASDVLRLLEHVDPRDEAELRKRLEALTTSGATNAVITYTMKRRLAH